MNGRWSADGERGDVILGWLTKICIVLVVVGVAGFDTISIASTKLQTSDDANSAASAAYDAWDQNNHDVQMAYNAAVAYGAEHNERIPAKSFTVGPTGAVSLEMVHMARTVAVKHIGPLQHLQVIRAHGTATAPTP